MRTTLFIDGMHGTTGLRILEDLAPYSDDFEILSVDPGRRRQREERKRLLNQADIAVLCLPDDAARDAVSLIENSTTRILDASSAHRVTPGWTYGLPELHDSAREEIRVADRVSNPGCYPTGFVLLIAPLVRDGLLPASSQLSVHAVSGYSGGGRARIEECEKADSAVPPYQRYSLQTEHKHVKEMTAYAHLEHPPNFLPAYGNYRQGILLQVPLVPSQAGALKAVDIRESWLSAYGKHDLVDVVTEARTERLTSLTPTALNGSNRVELHLLETAPLGQLAAAAVYDNLGKGASGAAVQNLLIMAKG